jgi:glucose-1-phosphate thymidylyltransferase
MKGIILAGGKGSRLYPITYAISKQFLPIYDKPMIYYPLSVLMMAGIREIMIISTPQDRPRFEMLFGDGSQLGLSLHYGVQVEPKGIADAFLIAADFLEGQSAALILGDNIFYGQDLLPALQEARKLETGGLIFGYEVQDPERYGVMHLGPNRELLDIVEKPPVAPSRFAVTGLYFYDCDVVDIARLIKPSNRGELEITDVNRLYLQRGKLSYQILGRGFAWLDMGTYSALQSASAYVQTIQERQGIKIGCIEEVAYQMGYIDEQQLSALAEKLIPSEYGMYLQKLVSGSEAFATHCIT